MISTVITAVVSFVSTNIDDIFVLMLFFTQINNVMKRRHIVIGQYLGIFALVIIFMLLTALWCLFGFKLAKHPFVQVNIENYKHIFVPIIFIGLGIFILMKSGTIRFIYEKIS